MPTEWNSAALYLRKVEAVFVLYICFEALQAFLVEVGSLGHSGLWGWNRINWFSTVGWELGSAHKSIWLFLFPVSKFQSIQSPRTAKRGMPPIASIHLLCMILVLWSANSLSRSTTKHGQTTLPGQTAPSELLVERGASRKGLKLAGGNQ